MHTVKSIQTGGHGGKKEFVHDELSRFLQVFLRNDSVHSLLQPSFHGPFRMVDHV